MQIFYFSNSLNKQNNLADIRGRFREHPAIEGSNFRVNIFSWGQNQSLVRAQQDFVTAIGVFIYKGAWNKPALELFLADAAVGDLVTILRECRGQFFLVLRLKGQIYFITDKMASVPVYVYEKAGVLELSNVFLPLAKNNRCSINHQAMAEYLLKFVGYYKTLLNEIATLSRGSIYTFSGSRLERREYFDLFEGVCLGSKQDFDEVVEEARSVLINNLSFLDRNDKVNFDITGGFDTRTNLAIALHRGVRPAVGCVANASKDRLNDGLIAGQIAEKFNLDFNSFSCDGISAQEYEDKQGLAYLVAANSRYGYGGSLRHYRRTAYYAFLGGKYGINVSGLLGSELLTPYEYWQYAASHRRFDLDEFIRDCYPYYDIFKLSCVTKESYCAGIKKFFTTILQDRPFDRWQDLLTYFEYRAFCYNDFFKYVGMANCFIPFYTPFHEAETVRLALRIPYRFKMRYKIERIIIDSLNKELARIETTHGYPAAVISVGNFYRFTRLFYNFYPYGPWKGIKGALVSHLKKCGAVHHLAEKKHKAVDRFEPELDSHMPIFTIIDFEKARKIGAVNTKYSPHEVKYSMADRLWGLNKLFCDIGVL